MRLAAALAVLWLTSTSAQAASPDAGVASSDAGVVVPARPPFTWDVPGVLYGVEVPETLDANGTPVRLRALRSTWDIDSVFRHIAKSFVAYGLYVAPEEHQVAAARGYQITGLDVDTMVAYTAYLQPEGKGTLVVLGESWHAVKQTKQVEGFTATFPGAQDLTTFRSEAGDAMTYTAGAPPEVVLAFYRDVLGRSGYREKEAGVFIGTGEIVRVTAFPTSAGTSARSAVKVSRQRGWTGD